MNNFPNYLTVTEFCRKHTFMTEPSLRWILHQNPDGLEDCIMRPSSNRLFIDEKLFFEFIKNNSSKNITRRKKIIKNERNSNFRATN